MTVYKTSLNLISLLRKAKTIGGKYLKRWQVSNPRTGKMKWVYKYKPVSQRGAHEVTGKTFEKKTGGDRSEHKSAVEKALQSGNRVSLHILRDYPDLVQKYGMGKRLEKADKINAKVKEIREKQSAKSEPSEVSNSPIQIKNPVKFNGNFELKKETEKAYLVSMNVMMLRKPDANRKGKFITDIDVWIPKSVMNIDDSGNSVISDWYRDKLRNEITENVRKVFGMAGTAYFDSEYSRMLEKKKKKDLIKYKFGSISINSEGSYDIKFKYDPERIKKMKELSAKWIPAFKVWRVQEDKLPYVRKILS